MAFPMAWTCLVLCIALAAYLVWSSRPLDLGNGYVSEAESWKRWHEKLSPKAAARLRGGCR